MTVAPCLRDESRLDDQRIDAERHRGESDIAQDLDMDPAEPDHQHRAEIGVAADPEDNVVAGPRHRLNEDAVDLRAGMRRQRPRQDRAVALAHRYLAAEV